MSDKSLRQRIIDELDWDPRLDSAHIGVAVDDGIVSLSGHVPSYAQRVAAENAVKRIKGVRGVAQDIEVRVSGAAAQSDEDIAARALSVLRWNTQVPAGAIQVTVSKGWITLSGEVDQGFQCREAEHAVRGLAGVTGVSNAINVRPKAAAADIARRIEAALERDAAVEAKGVEVSVTEGKVTLRGVVHSWRERDAVEQAAWSAPGVRAVDDHVLIDW